MDERMDELFDEFLGSIWKLADDLDCLLQLTDDLTDFYEYTADHHSRRLVKFIGLAIGQTRDQLKAAVKEIVYQQQESTEES